jgi:putative RNA 2'-phosphotransferase
MDQDGWVSIDNLVRGLHESDARWSKVSRQDVEFLTASAVKKRHEISGDLIRALYGHSTPGQVRHVEAMPPEVLYHGTTPAAWKSIKAEGLTPMKRQFVHLSPDRATALRVGNRRSSDVVVLRVDALAAHSSGHKFYVGGDSVWLTDRVPAKFLSPSE